MLIEQLDDDIGVLVASDVVHLTPLSAQDYQRVLTYESSPEAPHSTPPGVARGQRVAQGC